MKKLIYLLFWLSLIIDFLIILFDKNLIYHIYSCLEKDDNLWNNTSFIILLFLIFFTMFLLIIIMMMSILNRKKKKRFGKNKEI